MSVVVSALGGRLKYIQSEINPFRPVADLANLGENLTEPLRVTLSQLGLPITDLVEPTAEPILPRRSGDPCLRL